MRVLAVTHSLGCNGAAWALCRVLVAIKDAGGTVDVIYKGNEPFAEYLQDHGVGIIAQAQTRQYDVALVNTIIDHGWVEELAAFLPVVFWVHEGASYRDNEIRLAIKWQQAFRLSSRLVFVNKVNEYQSESVFKSFLGGIEPHRVLHVNYGIDIPVQARVRQNRESPGSSIISVGSVYPRKCPDDIVDAVTRMGNPKIHCTFVGGLDWMHLNGQSMKDSLAKYPALFTLAGEIMDEQQKLRFLRDSDVFCSASCDETFNISALEAAFMGLPLALSDLPCYQGIWKHGVNALLAPVGAIDCLTWNLRALTQDQHLAARLGRAAMQTAAQYTLEENLRGMTDALLQAVHDPVRRPG